MNNDMQLYYDYAVSPLGKLFYKTIWSQLEEFKNKKILDFGSGFGFTSNFLAKSNDVTALEQDKSMIDAAENTNTYFQIHGDLQDVKAMDDECFDIITCHLVFEFVENPAHILKELTRVLKKGGVLSIVRHNKNGRIIQAVVQDYDLDDANSLLDGGFSYSSAFGNIKYYTNDDLFNWIEIDMQVLKISGARVLASLHTPEVQNKDNWIDKMFAIESKFLQHTDFINISYFNHILLQKR